MSLGIIPLGIQDTDPSYNVNAACMAMPWLVSMGFSILFSALFAKIWRIMLVWRAAKRFRPKKVGVKVNACIFVLMFISFPLSKPGNGKCFSSLGCPIDHDWSRIVASNRFIMLAIP